MTRIETVQLVADPYPPYQYLEGQTVRGADHDVIAAALGEQGLHSRTRLLPWDECVRLMESGEAHGIFQIQPTPEREKAYTFSVPLRTAKTVLFRNTQKPTDLVGTGKLRAALEQYVLGTVKGYTYDPLIDELEEPSRIVVESQERLLTGLSEGKFDLAIIDLGVGLYLSSMLRIRNIVRVEGYEIARVLHVAFQRTLSDISDHFNTGLEAVTKKGIRDRILTEYGVSG